MFLRMQSSTCLYQTIELWYGTLAARLTDVPDLHAALAAGVNVPRGVADGYSAYHLTVAECVDLSSMTGYAWPNQSIWRKRNWLHLAVRADVEGVGPIYKNMIFLFSFTFKLTLNSPNSPF